MCVCVFDMCAVVCVQVNLLSSYASDPLSETEHTGPVGFLPVQWERRQKGNVREEAQRDRRVIHTFV